MIWLPRVWMLACLCLFGSSALAAAPPAKVMQALERGVNLSLWYTFRDSPWTEPARWYPDAADWRKIKALGFRHVRVQFDPAYFRDPAQPGVLRRDRLRQLRRELQPAWDLGLVVVLAAEPEGAEEKSRLVRDEAGVAELAQFWRAFAAALKGIAPKRLVFEALNEPTETDAARNRQLMLRLVDAIRRSAPRHTVVVGGHGYSGIDELLALEPLPQPNLIYSFHFYEPHNFTHQGATWSWPMLTQFKDLPYPSSPEAVAAPLAAAADEAKPHIGYYGEQRWDRARLEARLDRVRDWAAAKNLPVWCGEFGVSRLGPPLDARRRWIADTIASLEARGIPWTAFDYAGSFGLVTGTAGARQLDPLDAAAYRPDTAARPAAQ